jgi:hypothetical protein
MRKTLTMLATAMLFSANAFATYIVVLRNGSSYKAKSKWTVVGGKALVSLENGQSLRLDPSEIDEARSEQATASGLGVAKRLDTQQSDTAPAPSAPSAPSLGAAIKLRKQGSTANTPSPNMTAPAAPAPASGEPAGRMSTEITDKFERAYENVGLFEHKLTSASPTTLHVELTADTEDKVFNAISATSFLMVRNAGVVGAKIDMVELFMKTTTGGSAGRFQMTREDADALDTKKMSQQDYFVRKVIY